MHSGHADVPPQGAADAPVLLVASAGGHLAQLVALREWWEELPRVWVSDSSPAVVSQLDGERLEFAHFPTTRNVPNLLRNFVVAFRVLRRTRPRLVVSTGAAVAIPFFVLARVFGIPTVYLEVYDRVDSATVTGRVCYRLCSAFAVQWDAQRTFYPRAHNIGSVL